MIDDFNPMKVLIYKEKLNELVRFHSNKSNKIPDPIMLEIDFSNVCNYRCSFCQCADIFDHDHTKCFITDEDWFGNILPFIVKRNVEGVFVCGGGEPLVNKNAAKYLDSLDGLNVKVCMTSNGSLINNELAKSCAKVCEWVTFSVNAGDENSFNNTNNPKDKKLSWTDYTDNLCKFLEEFRKFCFDFERFPEISYKFVYTPENFRSMYNAALLAEAFGFGQFIAKPADLTWSREGFAKEWDPSDEKEIEHILTSIRAERKIKTKTLEIYREEDCSVYRGYSNCWTQSLAPVLHPDGNMSICCDLREVYNIGRWDKPSLDEFWGSYDHIKSIRRFNEKEMKMCPKRCRMGRYNKVVQKVMIDGKVNTCFL